MLGNSILYAERSEQGARARVCDRVQSAKHDHHCCVGSDCSSRASSSREVFVHSFAIAIHMTIKIRL